MPSSFWTSQEVEQSYLDVRRREASRRAAMVPRLTPENADRVVNLTAQAPNASPGVVGVGVESGMADEAILDLAKDDDGGWSPFSLVDSVTSAVTGLFDEVIYQRGIKPLVRSAFTLSEGLAQELVQRPLTAAMTAFTDDNAAGFGDAYNQYGDSALLNIAQGEVNPFAQGSMGEGFFTGGQAQQQVEQDRTLTIDGGRAGLGRAVAGSLHSANILDSGSQAYNLVSGVTQFAADVLLDPLALVSGGSSVAAKGAAKGAKALGGNAKQVVRVQEAVEGGLSGVRARAKSFEGARDIAADLAERAGAFESMGRKGVLAEKATDVLGRREILSKLAEANTAEIWKSWNRSSANQLDADIIRRLGEAGTEDEVARVLMESIAGNKLNDKGFYTGATARRKAKDRKVTGVAATGTVSHHDIPGSTEKIHSFLKQAKVDESIRDEIITDLIGLSAFSPAEQSKRFYGVLTRTMHEASAKIVDPEMAENLTTLYKRFEGDAAEMRMFGITDEGGVILTPLTKFKDGTPAPTPQLTTEMADLVYQLPDVKDVRRAAKRVGNMEKLWSNKGWSGFADGLDTITRDIFKPAALLRPAYVIRIGLEEQLRLAAAGYDSLFNHPFRFIQHHVLTGKFEDAVGPDEFKAKGFNRPFQWLKDKGGVYPNRWGKGGLETDDATFIKMAEDTNVLNRLAHDQRQKTTAPGHASREPWVPREKPEVMDAAYANDWDRELAQLVGEPSARMIAATGNDLDAVMDWARNTDEGRKSMDLLAAIDEEVGPAILSDDDVLRDYLATVAERISYKAGGRGRRLPDGTYQVDSLGDQQLLDFIATGRRDSGLLSRKFDEFGPKVVKSEVKAPPEKSKRLDRAITMMFDEITGKPTTALARYPVVRQAMVKYAGEAMDALATPELRRELIESLESSFSLTKAEKKSLASKAIKHGDAKGQFDNVKDFEDAIKIRAMQETKDLLFDATQRSNFQEAYNAAVPFFDAWAEVTKTWTRLAAENPAFFIKAGQGLDSARESGVIYTNDFGEEVFAYPGGGMLSKFFAGDSSLRLEGRLQGANLVAQGVGPGFGPMVQWGIGAFMPDNPQTQGLMDWAAPFGTGGIESGADLANPGKLATSLVPAWGKKFLNAVSGGQIDPVQWNSTMGDAMKVLAESGTYDPADPNDKERLLRDAQRAAKTVLLVRALTQGVAITGASATWQVKSDVQAEALPEDWDLETDPDGKFHSMAVLANEYRKLLEHYNYDDDIAASTFIETFGVDPFHVGQAKTRSLANLPVTQQGNYWIKDHMGASKKYPEVIGYFAPPDDGELDYGVYRAQIEAGDRQSLTARQQLELANAAKARAILNNVKRQVENLPKAAQDRALAQARGWLEDEYPGWSSPVLGVKGSGRQTDKIKELRRAVDDPDLADSGLTEPLRAYFTVRDAAEAEIKRRVGKPNATLARKEAADLRQKLLDFGLQLQAQDAAFAGVWVRLLSSEVNE